MDLLLEIENNRTEDNLFEIHLFKDRKTKWYTAYELSAYLMEFYPNYSGDKLKASKKTYRKNEIVLISLQIPAFKKYLPEIEIIESNSDHIILKCTLAFNDLNIDNYKKLVEDWKNSIILKKDKMNNIFTKPATFFSICKDILAYDTYGKSELDLRNFICKIKSDCSDLIF